MVFLAHLRFSSGQKMSKLCLENQGPVLKQKTEKHEQTKNGPGGSDNFFRPQILYSLFFQFKHLLNANHAYEYRLCICLNIKLYNVQYTTVPTIYTKTLCFKCLHNQKHIFCLECLRFNNQTFAFWERKKVCNRIKFGDTPSLFQIYCLP